MYLLTANAEEGYIYLLRQLPDLNEIIRRLIKIRTEMKQSEHIYGSC